MDDLDHIAWKVEQNIAGNLTFYQSSEEGLTLGSVSEAFALA